MINPNENNQTGGNGGNVIYVNKVSQFELWKAIYDSKLLATVKLTQTSKLVLISIARHYNPENEDCYPSYTCISSHCGISRKSVERGIKELALAGLITYRTERVNRYKFTAHFFAMVKLTLDQRQIDASHYGQIDAQTNKEEQIKNSGSVLKNSSSSEAAQETVSLENPKTEGHNEEQQENRLTPETIVFVERKSPPFAKNGRAYNTNGKTGTGQTTKPPTDGGGSRVPSIEETQGLIVDMRVDHRANDVSIEEYPSARARFWYANAGTEGRNSAVGQFLFNKYNGWKEEGGWFMLVPKHRIAEARAEFQSDDMEGQDSGSTTSRFES